MNDEMSEVRFFPVLFPGLFKSDDTDSYAASLNLADSFPFYCIIRMVAPICAGWLPLSRRGTEKKSGLPCKVASHDEPVGE